MAKKRVHTAKNWTAADAVKIIVEGKNFEAIADIMKRFPIFAYYAMKVNDAGVFLLSAMPEYFTARKVNSFLSGNTAALDGDDESISDEEIDNDSDDEDEIEEKPAKKTGKRGRPVKKSEPVDDDDDEDEDEEEEEIKPKKSKKAAKKSSKRVVEDDDEDDEDDEDEDEKPVKKSSKGKKKSKPVDDDDDDFDFDD